MDPSFNNNQQLNDIGFEVLCTYIFTGKEKIDFTSLHNNHNPWVHFLAKKND